MSQTPMNPAPYQALLLVSFGGPEKPEDVMPFLENVTRGRGIPRERLEEVAEHYYHFGGKSPLNEQNRALIQALEAELARAGRALPIYFGNRNWDPFLAEALEQMKRDGIERALALFTTPFSSYSSCRQYRENLAEAAAKVGPGAPEVHKIRAYYNHPGFLEAVAELTREALEGLPSELRAGAGLLYTAHSIPSTMAAGCDYEAQLLDSVEWVNGQLGRAGRLVYQSRSGPPSQPWLEPDVLDEIRRLHAEGLRALVLSPIGFLSDHMEVLYDLDTEARDLCEELGVVMIRAASVGTHPRFIEGLRELIEERLEPGRERRAYGPRGPNHDLCPVDCCPPPPRRPAPSSSAPARA